jgi:methylmalonyl-CoA mutase N-terminal domain/subunit
MEILFAGLPLDRITTSMTINSPDAAIWAMYIVNAEKRGFPRASLGVHYKMISSGVQRFTVVDNSDFSPHRLTALSTLLILERQGAHHAPHFKQ